MSGARAPKWDFSDFDEEDEDNRAKGAPTAPSAYARRFTRPAQTYNPKTSQHFNQSYYDYRYRYQDTLRPRRINPAVSVENLIAWLNSLTRRQLGLGLLGLTLGSLLLVGWFSWIIQQNKAKEIYLFQQSVATVLKSSPQLQSASKAAGPYSVMRSPTITPEKIEAVLRQYNSPALGTGKAMYDLGVRYGIDPAYALAFFIHESSAGTQGVAVTTKSIGNIRCTPGYDCLQTSSNGSFRRYVSWEAGIEDWYKLIKDLYVGKWGLITLDQIIPVYAPSADRNNPASYIKHVASLIDGWK